MAGVMTMRAILRPLLEMRPTDAVDILLVTALVYTMVIWIRRTQAALVALGIVILGVFYLAAQALGLQLTAWLFRGFFAIFIIMIVVIFQEELRQLFERVAVWSLPRSRPGAPRSDTVDVLVQCLSEFARDGVGALVVIPGTQPIRRHVRGGVELDGKLSVPLLKSIFDPHSPGHDGAVIVENDRVSRFAAHLPLSRDFRQLAGVGTRHSAALGLAELTDALCLVVSEERGRISFAKDRLLQPLADPQALGVILQQFLAPPGQPGNPWQVCKHLAREHWLEKVVSLTLVVGLWYLFVPGSRPVQASYEVPVKVINLAAAYLLDRVKPPEVEATFAGPARAFYFFDPRKLAVTIDATRIRRGRQTFEIVEQDLRYPKDVTLLDLHPRQVTIAVRRKPGDDAVPGGGSR